jgi:hypothetical protein
MHSSFRLFERQSDSVIGWSFEFTRRIDIRHRWFSLLRLKYQVHSFEIQSILWWYMKCKLIIDQSSIDWIEIIRYQQSAGIRTTAHYSHQTNGNKIDFDPNTYAWNIFVPFRKFASGFFPFICYITTMFWDMIKNPVFPRIPWKTGSEFRNSEATIIRESLRLISSVEFHHQIQVSTHTSSQPSSSKFFLEWVDGRLVESKSELVSKHSIGQWKLVAMISFKVAADVSFKEQSIGEKGNDT